MNKLLFSFLAFAISAVPVLAFEIPMPEGMKLDMYGQARMTAAYEYSNASDKTKNIISSDFKMRWQGNSRFGINFSAGNFFANAEMNVQPDQTLPLLPIGFRQFYGGYTFENGLTLIAGNKSTLTGNGISSDVYFVDNGLVGFGTVSDSRRPMLMVSYAGLSVAAVANIDNQILTNADDIAETYIPRFEIAYDYESDFMTARVFGTYGLFTQKHGTNGTDRTNVHAWHAGFDIMPTFGSMYVGISAFVGMNAGMYGAVYMLNNTGDDVTEIKPSFDGENNDNLNDVLTWGVAAVFGMQVSEMISFEIGGGYQDSTADNFRSYKDGKKVGIAGYAAYIQTPITFAEGHFTLVPQVGYYARQTDYYIYDDETQTGATSVGALIAGAQLVVKF